MDSVHRRDSAAYQARLVDHQRRRQTSAQGATSASRRDVCALVSKKGKEVGAIRVEDELDAIASHTMARLACGHRST